jgi:hypothetical protein
MNRCRRTPADLCFGNLIKLLSVVTLLAGTLMWQSCNTADSVPASPTLVAIKISPTTPYLPLAGSRQLIATGIYSDATQIDITPSVTWSASSASSNNPNSLTFVSVNSTGVATGLQLGASVVSATSGSVTGLLQITVTTNGYSSSTIGILVVPFGSGEIDAAYLPRSENLIQGVYTVQELNLDADQFTSVLPPPSALIASIPMPAGFVPNATAASQASFEVAVVSYTSPDIQIIDASNIAADTANNTVIATYKAPVSKNVTFGGKTCMICAAVINPLNDELLLSTAQGYYTMDLNTGTFTALSLASTGFPSPGFALNPTAANPYIISPTFGQDQKFPSEVQVLNLPSSTNPQGSVTAYTNFGLTAPNANVISFIAGTSSTGAATNDVVVVDSGARDQTFVTLGDSSQSTSFLPISDIAICSGVPSGVTLDMAALGILPSPSPGQATAPTMFLSQSLGDCVGFEVWILTGVFDPTQVLYGYGTLPDTPDGMPFKNGADANAIATFSTVFGSGKNYGVLVDGNQDWAAKLDLANITNDIPTADFLPSGFDISEFLLQKGPANPVEYLPTPGTIAILSQNNVPFGNQGVGTSSIQIPITLTNINTTPLSNLQISQITIEGPNASDFSQTNLCANLLAAQSKCTILVTFTPSAAGLRSATLSITDDGGDSPQTVALSGTGT